MLKLLASLLLSCCVALGVSLSPAAAMGVYDLPILSPGAPTYVVDPVAAISAANEGKLNKDLKNLAEKTGQEVRMVVVRRLDYGQKIDNLADDILREWYPNSEDRANQTIIVLDTLT
ncbi:MAG: TPM domain-containing protein, partial [Microcystis sp. M53600_WE12]|nr:TPM domain-containing protein [Microcystis sp. M53600_WE12]